MRGSGFTRCLFTFYKIWNLFVLKTTLTYVLFVFTKKNATMSKIVKTSKTIKTIIVLLGAPYCGKGTQSKLIAKKYGLCHVSTGDILREKAKEGNALGRQIKDKDLIDAGIYVPDTMMTDILKETLLKNFASNGFVLDGYPRTMRQKTMLKHVFKSLSLDVKPHTIILDVSEQELIRRHLLRMQMENRVDDHDEQVLEERKKQFEKTIPVIEAFKADKKATATTITVLDEMQPNGIFTLIQQVLAGKIH